MMLEIMWLQELFGGIVSASLRWTPIFLAAFIAARFLPAAVDRRRLWSFALLSLPALPWLAILAPTLEVAEWSAAAGFEISQDSIPAPVEGVPAALEGTAAAPAPTGWEASTILPGLWLLGIGFFLTRELSSRLAAFALGRVCHEAPAKLRLEAKEAAESLGLRSPDIRLGRVRVPLLCGVLRPRVVLPIAAVSWPTSRLRASLLHELAHQRHRDPWLDFGARLLSALFFFHPGVWLARRALGEEMEQVADAAVVRVGRNDGLDATTYGGILLDIAKQARGFAPAGLAMARPGGLELRLRALISDHPPSSRARQLVVVSLLALTTLSAAGLSTDHGEWLRESKGGWDLQCGESAECRAVQAETSRILEESGRQGVLIVQKVETGEIVGYAARGPAPVPIVPPASVAKLAVATIWWETGLGDQGIPCPKKWTSPDGIEVRAVRERGVIDSPHQMLIHSCSTAAGAMMAQLVKEEGADQLRDELAHFGFAAGEKSGWLPSFLPTPRLDAGPAWESRRPEMAAALGRVSTTPFHVVSFLQAIGHDGVRLAMGRPGEGIGPDERLMTPETAQRLRRSMAAVVSEGTGQRAGKVLEGEAWQLLGKTGTRAREDGAYDGWFAGLAADRAQKPRFAVVAFLDGAGMGSGEPTLLAAELTRSLGSL